MRMTKQELTEHTIAVWQPRHRRRLSKEDAREITENITGFFTNLWAYAQELIEQGSTGGQEAAGKAKQGRVQGLHRVLRERQCGAP